MRRRQYGPPTPRSWQAQLTRVSPRLAASVCSLSPPSVRCCPCPGDGGVDTAALALRWPIGTDDPQFTGLVQTCDKLRCRCNSNSPWHTWSAALTRHLWECAHRQTCSLAESMEGSVEGCPGWGWGGGAGRAGSSSRTLTRYLSISQRAALCRWGPLPKPRGLARDRVHQDRAASPLAGR